MISRFFIDHPRFAFVISILFLLAGGIALLTLPVTQYPNISPSLISISANYPGADAQTVMDTVIQPIESKVNGVKKMLYMSSSAADNGSAVINVTFDIGTDGDQNTVNTQNRVNWATAQLPEEVQRQGVTVKEKSANMLMVLSLYSPDGSMDALALSNFLSIYVKDQLARIPGVGDVVQFGEMTFAMRVWLDPDKLAALKLTVGDVTAAIRAQNVQVSAGSLGDSPAGKDQAFRLAVSTRGRLEDVEDFKNIVIRSSPDGSNIRLHDIAEVELGAENYSSICLSNGQPAAAMAVYQLNDANGLEIARQILEKMENLKKELFPPGLEYRIQYDSTGFIVSSIDEVRKTLIEAVLLVVLVTFLFLQDWRSTLVPTIAIPVSLIGTFAVMSVLGYSINLITLFGLILAIGIVVDDAIVVIENVNRLMEEEDLDPRSAAIKSMEQVTGPVIATTAVLLAMFVPVCFLPGITGVMYRQFGVTISVAVLISSVNALTLSPALSAVLLKKNSGKKRKKFFLFRCFDAFFDKFTAGYMVLVRLLVRKAFVVLLIVAGLLFASWRIFGILPSGFVPEEDQGAFFINIQLPDAAALPRTEEVLEKINERLQKLDSVDKYLTVAGFNIINGISASNCGLGIVVLKDWNERPGKKTQNDVIAEFRKLVEDIPEAAIMPFGVPTIPGIGTTGGFSNELVAEANSDPVLSGVFSTYRATFPQVYLDIDREKALKMGVELDTVNAALQGLFGYTYVNDFNKFGKSYKVEVQAKADARDDISDISAVKIRNRYGEMLPLGTLASVRQKFVPQYLSRYNMLSSVQITGSPAPGHSSGEAMDAMERIAREKLPDGMTFEWTDMSYQEKLAGGQIYLIFALALLFIYLFLVAQYESWMLPISVILSVPVALFGALISLLITRIDNNIYAQVGFVLLFGIACKTAILIVEFAREQREKGMGIVESAEFAAHLRFRAVLMTAVSFILGTYPLVVAFGASSVSRRSLGTAVFGGMVVSVIFGTLMIPAVFVVVQWITEFFCGKKKESAPVIPATPPEK